MAGRFLRALFLLVVASSFLLASFSIRASEAYPSDGACTHSSGPLIAASAAQPAVAFALNSRVTDLTGVLSEACKRELANALKSLEERSRVQLAVLLVSTTGQQSIEEYANDVFVESKLGQARVDNGLLLVAALNDRRVRLEVGYGLEGVVTDLVAAQIIADDIKPAFKTNRFEEGLRDAVKDISERVAPDEQSVLGDLASSAATDAIANASDNEINDSAETNEQHANDSDYLVVPRKHTDEVKDFVEKMRSLFVHAAIFLVPLLLGALFGARLRAARYGNLFLAVGCVITVVGLIVLSFELGLRKTLPDAPDLAFWCGVCPYFFGVLMARHEDLRQLVLNLAGLACLLAAPYLAWFSVTHTLPIGLDIAVVGGACLLVVAAFFLMDGSFIFGLLFAGAGVALSSKTVSSSSSSSSSSFFSGNSSNSESSSSESSSDSFSGDGGDSGGGGSSDSW